MAVGLKEAALVLSQIDRVVSGDKEETLGKKTQTSKQSRISLFKNNDSAL